MSVRPFPITPVPEWEARFPWLRAGTTRRVGGRAGSSHEPHAPSPAAEGPRACGSDHAPGAPRDPGAPPLGDMLLCTGEDPWRSVVRSLQVHGAHVRVHGDPPAGPVVVGEGDGHVTRTPGALLTVTIADCVPVFIADPVRRAVGLLHAGWRGTAAGVGESGMVALGEAFGSKPGDLTVHLGPAICGECYEVGPEVFRALGEPTPATPRPIDLRRAIRRRVIGSGVRAGQVTVSGECTRCGDGSYFSHRRGDTGRQRAFIGILA